MMRPYNTNFHLHTTLDTSSDATDEPPDTPSTIRNILLLSGPNKKFKVYTEAINEMKNCCCNIYEIVMKFVK
jgi:hypothetical protein